MKIMSIDDHYTGALVWILTLSLTSYMTLDESLTFPHPQNEKSGNKNTDLIVLLWGLNKILFL